MRGEAELLSALSCTKHNLNVLLGCRWQRADKLGLQPPKEVLHILDALQDDDARLQCLWHGRI